MMIVFWRAVSVAVAAMDGGGGCRKARTNAPGASSLVRVHRSSCAASSPTHTTCHRTSQLPSQPPRGGLPAIAQLATALALRARSSK